MSGKVEFVHIKLPSGGKCYKNFDPAKVMIRPMTAADEKLIREMNTNNAAAKWEALMKNVLIGVNPNEMTIGDRNYVLVWLAANSYDKTVMVGGMCQSCYQPITIPVDLSKLKINELPDDFKSVSTISLSDGPISLRLLTVDDEAKVWEYERSGQGSWVYQFALSVVDREHDFDQIMTRMGAMSSKDFAKIRAFHEYYDHGPVMEVDYKCPRNCGGTGLKMPVPFQRDWLLPVGEALKVYFGSPVLADASPAHEPGGNK
jgi:hypothetical protein